MRVWTLHAPAGRSSVPTTEAARVRLIREGIAWGGLLFGPLWLVWHGVLLSGVALLGAMIATLLLWPEAAPLAWLAAHVTCCLFGRDLQRRRLERTGLPVIGVIAAEDLERAHARLARIRPDLARGLLRG
jgi:hypothetical protein